MNKSKFKIGDKISISKTHRKGMIGKIVALAPPHANYHWLIEIQDGDWGFWEDEIELHIESQMKNLLVEFAQVHDKGILFSLQERVREFLNENFLDYEKEIENASATKTP